MMRGGGEAGQKTLVDVGMSSLGAGAGAGAGAGEIQHLTPQHKKEISTSPLKELKP